MQECRQNLHASFISTDLTSNMSTVLNLGMIEFKYYSLDGKCWDPHTAPVPLELDLWAITSDD
jgi:hypothetical protein